MHDINTKLIQAIIENNNLKGIVESLKVSSPPSLFLQSYSASTSLSTGIIGRIPSSAPRSTAGPLKPSEKNSKNSRILYDNEKINRKSLEGNLDEENKDPPTTYCSDSILIKAADEFRIIIPIKTKKSFHITWDFIISIYDKNKINKKTGEKNILSNLDIGFTIIEKLPNGSLPQIIPYSRIRGGSKNGVTFLIDEDKDNNAEGTKALNSIEDEKNDNKMIHNEDLEERGTGKGEGSSVPSSSSKKSPISGENGNSLDLEFSGEDDSDEDVVIEGMIKEKDWESGTTEDYEDEDSFRNLIVLFDNSYSWYKPKDIKYTITVKILP